MNRITGRVDYSGCRTAELAEPVVEVPERPLSVRRGDWSDDDVNTLRKLWSVSDSLEIGLRLGRTPNAVSHRASLLGLSRKRVG